MKMNRRTKMTFVLAALLSAGVPRIVHSMKWAPIGTCSQFVEDCRAAVMCYDNCGNILWGATWDRWF
jgi:hypothetical protein